LNHFTTSTGERVSQKQIDYRIRRAKGQKIEQFLSEHGYLVCQDCGQNDCKAVDCSHDKSVDWCKKHGCLELAWDVNNITLRGRKCHRIHDKLDIK